MDNSRTQNSPPVAVLSRSHCFVGNTAMVTSMGNCLMQDLARLSTKRDETAAAYAQQIALTQAESGRRADTIDGYAATLKQSLAPVDLSGVNAAVAAAKGELQALYASTVAQLQAECETELAAIMPMAKVRDPQTNEVVNRRIVRVWEQPPVTTLVDVVIDVIVQLNDNVESEHLVKVRCTPDHMFATPNGDVEASKLAGVEIWRVHPDNSIDTFVVPDVQGVNLSDAVQVFDAEIEGIAAYCVAPDGGVAAVVHNSHYTQP